MADKIDIKKGVEAILFDTDAEPEHIGKIVSLLCDDLLKKDEPKGETTIEQRVKRIIEINEQRSKLGAERGKLLLAGGYKVICGYCYRDNEEGQTYEEHLKQPGAFYKGCTVPLGIYLDFWEKDETGKWQRNELNKKYDIHYGGKFHE